MLGLGCTLARVWLARVSLLRLDGEDAEGWVLMRVAGSGEGVRHFGTGAWQPHCGGAGAAATAVPAARLCQRQGYRSAGDPCTYSILRQAYQRRPRF